MDCCCAFVGGYLLSVPAIAASSSGAHALAGRQLCWRAVAGKAAEPAIDPNRRCGKSTTTVYRPSNSALPKMAARRTSPPDCPTGAVPSNSEALRRSRHRIAVPQPSHRVYGPPARQPYRCGATARTTYLKERWPECRYPIASAWAGSSRRAESPPSAPRGLQAVRQA